MVSAAAALRDLGAWPDYDEGAATLLKQRVLSFLDNIE
jgi:hypothetical protein